MLYIGVDLGTSAVKLLLMDEEGKIRNIVSKEYPLFFPHPGWSEQRPQDWFEQSMEGIRELTEECDKEEVAGISFGGQMHGLVALDKDDNVIRPAILWNDGRTGEETDYLNRVIGKERLSAYTANIAFAGFTAPKILWMKKHEPENFGKISKIMLPKDYLAYKLSGSFCTDVSDASGMLLMDVKNRCWSEEMLDICGITKAQLPALHESYEVVGTLRPGIAEELGLPKSVKVIAGAGDNAAAAVGTGTVGEGRCNISLGTSGTIFISSKKFGVDEHNALHSFAHADGNYHLMGCILSAAACNKWWSEEILKSKDFAAEQSGITRLGENHVFYLPYLMGERSPHNNPDARAMFIGMSMDTTREDPGRAGRRHIRPSGFPGSGKKHWHPDRAHEDLRRRSQKPAVEEDHRKCDEHERRCDRERGRTGAWRGHAGGSGLQSLPGCGDDRQKTGKSSRYGRTRFGTGGKIRGKVSEVPEDISYGEGIILREFWRWRRQCLGEIHAPSPRAVRQFPQFPPNS